MSRALSALLEELRAKRVDLKLDGEQLRLQAPKGVLTPQLQQELRQQKGELLRFLRAARSSRTPTSPLGPRARNGRIPLSYAQEGAWLGRQAPARHCLQHPYAVPDDGPVPRGGRSGNIYRCHRQARLPAHACSEKPKEFPTR